MTVQEILREVKPHKKMSRPSLYAHMKALKIKPLGAIQQKPQQYPDSTPTRILSRLGLAGHSKRRAR